MADYDISVEIDPSGARVGRRAVEAELTALDRSAQRLRTSIAAALAFTGLSVGVAALTQYADAYTNINNRIRTVTSSQAEAAKVMDQVYQIAQRTRQSWSATAESYARTALAAKELGITQAEVLRFTESLNKAVILSGASAQEAQAGLIQLSQGLASGALRGDELRSVLEQLPAVADVIARYLGVTRGELRQLGQDGKISAATIINAFSQAEQELNERFAKTIPTVAQGFQALENAVIKYFGEITTGTGAQSALANGMILLANNIDKVAQSLAILAAFFITRWIAGALLSGIAATSAYITQTIALEVALGAVGTRAAVASAGMKVLQGAFATVTSTAAILTAGLFAIGAGIVYMVNEAYSAQGVLDNMDAASSDAVNGLLDLEEKARAAGLNVNTLGGAANDTNPLIRALAGAYGGAADEAARLAQNARAAAIAVAKAKIEELKAEREALGYETNKGVRSGNILSGIKYTAQGLLGELGLGPTYERRNAGIETKSNQIDVYERQVSVLENSPDAAFQPRKLPETVAPSDSKKPRSRGRSDAEILADFNKRLQDDIELSALSGAAHEKRAAILGLENQLNRELTDSEAAVIGKRLDELQVVKDRAALKEYDDAMKQEITLLGLSNRERERQEEIFRVEDQLKRKLTDTEKALVDARIDELQAARDAKYLRDAVDDLARENQVLRTNVEDRKIRAEILKIEADLGRALDPITRKSIENMLRENDALDRQNKLYEQITQTKRDLSQRREDLGAIRGRLTPEEFQRAVYDLRIDEITQRINAGSASMAEGFISELARMSEAARNWKGTAGQIFGQFFSEFSQGIGDSIGRAIVFSEDLGASLLDVARNAVASLISSFVQLGIQLLINKLIMKAFGNDVLLGTAEQGAAAAAAWAPAAALASLATLGSNAGAAIGGIALTLAATKALSIGVGAFADGGYVSGPGGPRDDAVLARLSNGEFVMNAKATSENRSLLEALNSGASLARPSRTGNGAPVTGDGLAIDVSGGIHINMPAGTTPDQGAAIGREVKEAIKSITREELKRQSQDGGALTKKRQSVMAD